MNRYELILIIAIAATATIVLIKSKRFDRFVRSLLNGSNSVTASDIKNNATQVHKAARARNKELSQEEKNLHKEKSVLKDL